MIAIFKKELKTYFASMTGYIFIGILLLLAGIMCLAINLFNGPTNYELSLSMVSYIFLLIVPILTMSVMADEKKNKTDQLLYSLPINASDIVIGKFGAIAAVFAVPVIIMCLYPFILSFYGKVNFLSAYSGLFGFFLLGCALLAFGLFISSLTESPVIAAVICFFSLLFMYLLSSFASLIPASAFASYLCFIVLIAVIAFLVYILTNHSLFSMALFVIGCGGLTVLYFVNSSLFEGAFPAFLNWLCVYDRYIAFVNGMFDITSVVYYLSIVFLCLFFSVQSLEKRRWQ